MMEMGGPRAQKPTLLGVELSNYWFSDFACNQGGATKTASINQSQTIIMTISVIAITSNLITA